MKKQMLGQKLAETLEKVAVKQADNASIVVLHEPEMPKAVLEQLKASYDSTKR